ncbi:MAG: hypothetical protein QXF56_02405 [Candidatus Micrarchaeia archaeon]
MVKAMKEQVGFRFDAEFDGRVNNVVSFTHNKFLETPIHPVTKKEFRLMDARPLGVAERISNDFKLTNKLLADAIDALKKEHATLSGEEAQFFKEVIDELKKIRKKQLEGKELISDRLELLPKESAEFHAKADNTIIADPIKFTRLRFNQFSNIVIKEVEKSPEGKEKIVEKPWVARDTLPDYTADKIAEQYRGEKLIKVAELLEREAAKMEDRKEKAYFEEVAKELRLKYESY